MPKSSCTEPLRRRETGDDFVHDEECAVFAGEFAQPLQEPWLGKDYAHVGGDGLDDDGGDFAFMLGKKFFHCPEIVVRNIQRKLRQRLRNAGTFRDSESGKAGASLG